MNIAYLLSVLNLYLNKELNKKLNINITNLDDLVKIDFSYDSLNKTFIKLNNQLFFDNIKELIEKMQGDLDILNEEYKNDEYSIIFSNNRQINFINFSLENLQLIRNNFKTINEFTFNQINSNHLTYNEIYKQNKKYQLSFQMGFTGFLTLFLSAIWFLDIFMISLWIFKMMK